MVPNSISPLLSSAAHCRYFPSHKAHTGFSGFLSKAVLLKLVSKTCEAAMNISVKPPEELGAQEQGYCKREVRMRGQI